MTLEELEKNMEPTSKKVQAALKQKLAKEMEKERSDKQVRHQFMMTLAEFKEL